MNKFPFGSVAVAVTPAMRLVSDPLMESALAATVRIAGVVPVLTFAVAPDFLLGSLELSFRVNCEEGATVKVMVTRAVPVAASTKAGPVYLRMSMKIARTASLHHMSFHIEALIGLPTRIKGRKAFLSSVDHKIEEVCSKTRGILRGANGVKCLRFCIFSNENALG